MTPRPPTRPTIELKSPRNCADCGALLRTGTRARAYPTRNGFAFYGLKCHTRRQSEPKKPKAGRPKRSNLILYKLPETK